MKGKQYEENKAERRSISMPKWMWAEVDKSAEAKKEMMSAWFQSLVKKALKIKK